MSFFGKLLIVLVLFLSVSFMTVGLVVNRTHRDLKAASQDLRKQVDEEKKEYGELVTKHKKLDVQLGLEKRAALNQLRKLEHEQVALRQRNVLLTEDEQVLIDRRAELLKELADIQLENRQLADDVTSSRKDISDNETARSLAIKNTLQATEELHQLHGQLEDTLERNRAISRSLSQ